MGKWSINKSNGGRDIQRFSKGNTKPVLRLTNIIIASGAQVFYTILKDGRQPTGKNIFSTSVVATGNS